MRPDRGTVSCDEQISREMAFDKAKNGKKPKDKGGREIAIDIWQLLAHEIQRYFSAKQREQGNEEDGALGETVGHPAAYICVSNLEIDAESRIPTAGAALRM